MSLFFFGFISSETWTTTLAFVILVVFSLLLPTSKTRIRQGQVLCSSFGFFFLFPGVVNKVRN
jgi:hypothetical protein